MSIPLLLFLFVFYFFVIIVLYILVESDVLHCVKTLHSIDEFSEEELIVELQRRGVNMESAIRAKNTQPAEVIPFQRRAGLKPSPAKFFNMAI